MNEEENDQEKKEELEVDISNLISESQRTSQKS